MAEVRAFRALRFTKQTGEAGQLVCPPYDIISEDQRREYLRRNPHNIIRLELPREGADVYAQAGRTLEEWLAAGVLRQDGRDSLYIYEEEFALGGKTYSFQGAVCRVKLEEFSKGVVLPHEETLSKAKTDRFSLMAATNCNFSQIYSLYMDEDGVTARRLKNWSSGAPETEFADADGVVHRLWAVTDPGALAAFSSDFESRRLYIADGHHRYETALNYRDYLRETGRAKPGGECDYVLMTLVDMQSPGLIVFPTHRIVRGVEGFDGAALLDACAGMFHVKPYPGRAEAEQALAAAGDAGEKAFACFDRKNGWNLLTLRDREKARALFPDKSEALALLDVTILHALILDRHLGIGREKLADQSNLIYTRSAAEAEEASSSGGADCCFLLNPTKVAEIAAVAAAGEKMPQKSTYFYPKLITGLVMNKF